MKDISASAAPVYLDYAATTPVDPAVAEAMQPWLADPARCGNPSSLHVAGRRAQRAVEEARAEVAALLGVPPPTICFTSGATESDNLAIAGAARQHAHRGRHLITMKTEHKAVVDTCRALEREGFDVSWLAPEADGRLSLDTLDAAFREDTQLVSIMHVNNETGVIQDIAEIGERCRRRGVLFHCDAAQSAGKLALDLAELPVDMVSLTAHKFYGPKGIGALYIADRPGCSLQPIMYGGGQERGLRPGTSAVHQAVGFGAAARLARERRGRDFEHIAGLGHRLWRGVAELPGVIRNGSDTMAYPGILNVSATGVEGESLLLALAPLCVATGSACNSKNSEPSYVLRALGRDDHLAQSAIRFSIGRRTSVRDIDFAVERYGEALAHLRAIAPRAQSAS